LRQIHEHDAAGDGQGDRADDGENVIPGAPAGVGAWWRPGTAHRTPAVHCAPWARILAYVTGMVDQELPARNEYLVAENRILKAQLKGRLKLSDAMANKCLACLQH
jgi:hypothetical protein